MTKWPWVVVIMAALLLLAGTSQAAHIPPGCNTGDITLGLEKSTSDITNGDTVTYTVTLDNGPAPSCTASNITIQGFCPDSAGVPNAFPQVTFPVILDLPVPTPLFTVGTFSCVVKLDQGVTIASARNSLSGILNDLDGIDDPLLRANQVSVTVVTPCTPGTPGCPCTPGAPGCPRPSSVPTLSEWSFIGFGVFLALAAGVTLHRRRSRELP